MLKTTLLLMMFMVGCGSNDSKLDAPDTSHNLAKAFVLAQEPDAKCEVYYAKAGPALTDSVRCNLPNKREVYCQIDAINGPVCRRIDAAAAEEQAQAQSRAQATQQQALQAPPPTPQAPPPTPVPSKK